MDYNNQEMLDAMATEAERKLKKEEVVDYYDEREEANDNINLENIDYNQKEYDLYDEEISEEFEIDDVNEIFPGGPTESTVGIWKKTYPDCFVFATELSGVIFIARSITRLEYKKLVALPIDQLQREEVICSTCILFPHNVNWQEVNGLRGGIPSTLASIIMENSGFSKDYSVQIL